MTIKIMTLGLVLLMVLGLSACSQPDISQPSDPSLDEVGPEEVAPPEGVYQKIDAKTAYEKMEADPSIMVLDVRTQAEYNEGHIEGAVLLPYTEIVAGHSLLPSDLSATILVYCRSGNRSQTASNTLLKLGYTDVQDFGGIIDWPYEVVR